MNSTTTRLENEQLTMALIRRWPDYAVEYRGEVLSVINIMADNCIDENDPAGDYYIIETERTNSYGYSVGAGPEITVEPRRFVDERIWTDSARGHVRIIAELVIAGLNATFTVVDRPLLDREGT